MTNPQYPHAAAAGFHGWQDIATAPIGKDVIVGGYSDYDKEQTEAGFQTVIDIKVLNADYDDDGNEIPGWSCQTEEFIDTPSVWREVPPGPNQPDPTLAALDLCLKALERMALSKLSRDKVFKYEGSDDTDPIAQYEMGEAMGYHYRAIEAQEALAQVKALAPKGGE